MSYKLKFKEQALREWKKLADTTREFFKKKLMERLDQPRVASSKLRGMKNCYKIKLRQSGYRLVFEGRYSELVVVVIAVVKRDRNAIYKPVGKRL